MNDSIKQMQAELAQIEAEIAELEAQKGIQTSQDSQPQSAPQPAQPNSVVFTNGATPQDNYFSWQYEVNQRKAQEKAQQDSTPKESYLSAQWEINQRKAQEQAQQSAQPKESYLKAQWEINQRKAQAQAEQQPTQPQESYWSAQYARQQQAQDYPDYPKTGIPLIDRKIAQKIPLSALDIADVKRITGLDLHKYSADLNVKKVDATKAIFALQDTFKALDSNFDLMRATEKSAGSWNGIDRWLHRKTFGWTDLNDDNAMYQTKDDINVQHIAQAFAGGGKVTDQDKRYAREYYSTGLRSARNQVYSQVAVSKELLRELDKAIRINIDAGRKLPNEVWNAREKAMALESYVTDKANTDKFSYKEYNKLFNEFKTALQSFTEKENIPPEHLRPQ